MKTEAVAALEQLISAYESAWATARAHDDNTTPVMAVGDFIALTRAQDRLLGFVWAHFSGVDKDVERLMGEHLERCDARRKGAA